MRSPHSNSRTPPSPPKVRVRGRAVLQRSFPNLIQQRSSAFAMGVGKAIQAFQTRPVLSRIEPQFSGQSSMQYRSFDSLHVCPSSFVVPPQ